MKTNEKQNCLKKEKGITLIALVITIILLLILAGVSVRALTGYDGILEQTKVAVDTMDKDTTQDQNLLDKMDAFLNDFLSTLGELTPLKGTASVDANGLATTKTLIKPDANSNVQIVIPEGFAPVILNGSNSTTSLPGQDGSVKSIMAADQWKNITVEQINQGIVIVDNAITYTGTVPNFNEYVWVSIPDEKNFTRVAWESHIIYQEGSSNINEVTKPTLTTTPASNSFSEDNTTAEYVEMVNSVKTHKGFYIGRYEVSKNGTASQTKRGQDVWTSITNSDAITTCSNSTLAPNMHLIYGIEWDSTLSWLIGKATISAESGNALMTEHDIKNDSRYWGNYHTSLGNAANAPWEGNEMLKTGASEYWKANNIYDLAGNAQEWTHEKSQTDNRGAYRDAGATGKGNLKPVAMRDNWYAANGTSGSIGFRVSFYL